MSGRPGPSRRDALKALGVASALGGAVAAHPQVPRSIVEAAVARTNDSVSRLLGLQVTDPVSPFRGSYPDAVGLHSAGSASGIIEQMTAAFVHPRSAYQGNVALVERIRLAAGFLERAQSPQGNIDLLTTNFNSPPDTGFVTENVATAAAVARAHGNEGIVDILKPFLLKAAAGMASGGIHTPNHRWVVSAALAQVNSLFPDARYVGRINEWLAEGIDIDADGQFTERSTLTYNVVCDRAFIVMGHLLKRPELLEPARRNLRALTFLLHADGEVVTEISRRQDQYTRGGVGGYWFSLAYLARRDGDGQFAALARRVEMTSPRLSTLLEYPGLAEALPPDAALPEHFEQAMPAIGITRIRRGPRSATLILGGSSRLVTYRHGDAVVEGIRFATSFFGKGQFVPVEAHKQGAGFVYRQSLEAPYYQPIAEQVTTTTWTQVRMKRRQSEIARLEQSAEITETPTGLVIRLRASGTPGVPLAVEIAFREGGRFEGCEPIANAPGTYLLADGAGVYRAGRNSIRFGPGAGPHRYVQLRGAEPRLPGESVYITGFTPFDRTITLEST
jgi:hypothetical protein